MPDSDLEKALTDLEKALKRIDKLETLNYEKDNEKKRLKRENSALQKEIEKELEAIRIYQMIEKADIQPPAWLVATSDKEHAAMPVAVWSDQHYGRMQPANEVAGYNAYNDKIAEMRTKHVTESGIKVVKEFTSGLAFPGIVLPFLGDTFEGEIHAELTRSNSESVIETFARFLPIVAASISTYADAFGKTYVPGVMGNHTRRGNQMEHKNQARDSYDWLMMKTLVELFKGDDRVTIVPSDALEYRFQIYKTKITLSHGYFGGKGGADSYARVQNTLKRMAARDRIAGNEADLTLLGHYHTSIFGNGVFQCGSLAGLDSYAHDIAVTPEPPSQILFFVTPERGTTMRTPIYAEAPGERRHWKGVKYYRGGGEC